MKIFRVKALNGGIRGLENRLKQIKAHIVIGILASAGEHNKGTNGQTVAEIGFWNEFGTPNAKYPIPARPWLRTTIANNIEKYTYVLKKSLLDYLIGKQKSVSKVFSTVGLIAASDVKKAIVDLKYPENAPSTIAQKGSSNPLIDTGQLRQSVTWEYRPN